MVTITIIGRLVRDAELKYTPSGEALMNFSVATDRGVKSGTEWVKEASFWNCTMWGKRAESLNQYMIKGTQVGISGEAYEDRWEKDGEKKSRVKVTAHEIQLLGSKSQAGQKEEAPAKPDEWAEHQKRHQEPADPQGDIFTDDIPF